jgi:acetyl-CoA carboxylase carboxyl transferase subunit beta
MSWFKNIKSGIFTETKKDTPVNLWVKCESCKEVIYRKDLEATAQVCSHCGHHFVLTAPGYVDLLIDENTFTEFDEELQSNDPLKFVAKKKYKDSLASAQKRTGKLNGVLSGMGEMHRRKVSIGVMDFRFVGGSLGSVEGEKLARVLKRAYEEECPAIIISASGGARMQEGALSLMQMAKTSAWLAKLDKKGIPFVSLLTNLTTGGVTASYAMLGDINVSEPGALIGFAGARVIRETIRQNLPEGFQRAEFLKEKGFVDLIVERKDLKNQLSLMLEHFVG